MFTFFITAIVEMSVKLKYTELLKQAKQNLSDDYCPISFFTPSPHQWGADTIKCQFSRFGKGDKHYNHLLKDIDKLDYVRCAHIINTFLLGKFLYENCRSIEECVNDNIRRYVKNNFKKDFYFFWFLICLFHDLGYVEENKGKESDAFPNNLNQINILADVDGVPNLYKEVYLDYYNYRKFVFGVVDHGIFAGLKMYSNLCNIREEHARNNSDPKFWRKELEPIYNLASWVVLAHNIWFVKDTKRQDCEIYRKYGLDKLVLETKTEMAEQKQTQVIVDYPIKIEEYPFLFLFCLVDLVEPMKKIGKMECCEKVGINITSRELTITSYLDCACGEQYLKQISEANDWLTKTKREGNIVTFNF